MTSDRDDRRGRLGLLQRAHRLLRPAAHEEAGHGADPAARARPAPDRARAAARRGGPGRRDPRQDELARGRGHHPRALRRVAGGRADPPQRARHLLPAAGAQGRERRRSRWSRSSTASSSTRASSTSGTAATRRSTSRAPTGCRATSTAASSCCSRSRRPRARQKVLHGPRRDLPGQREGRAGSSRTAATSGAGRRRARSPTARSSSSTARRSARSTGSRAGAGVTLEPIRSPGRVTAKVRSRR